MTEDEYYAQIHKLGLRRTQVPTVFVTGFGEPYNVPDPSKYTPEQRVVIIEKLKRVMGVGWR